MSDEEVETTEDVVEETEESQDIEVPEGISGGSRQVNPDVSWLGAKFDHKVKEEKDIVDMFEALEKRCGGKKRTIAAITAHAYKTYIKDK